MTPLQRDIIAGHETAIDLYIDAIAVLITTHGGDPLTDTLINQYVAIVRVLIQEWKGMKNEVCNISNRDRDPTNANGCDRLLAKSTL